MFLPWLRWTTATMTTAVTEGPLRSSIAALQTNILKFQVAA